MQRLIWVPQSGARDLEGDQSGMETCSVGTMQLTFAASMSRFNEKAVSSLEDGARMVMTIIPAWMAWITSSCSTR